MPNKSTKLKRPTGFSSRRNERTAKWLSRLIVPVSFNGLASNQKYLKIKQRKPSRFNFDPREIEEQGKTGEAVLKMRRQDTAHRVFFDAVKGARLTPEQETRLYEILEDDPDNPLFLLTQHLLHEYDPAYALDVSLKLSRRRLRDVEFAIYVDEGFERGRYPKRRNGKLNLSATIRSLDRDQLDKFQLLTLTDDAIQKCYRRGKKLLGAHSSLKFKSNS